MKHALVIGNLVIAAALLFAAAPAATADAGQHRYVAGGHPDAPGACATWGDVAVAGDCRIPLQPGERTLRVEDDALGAVEFRWSAGTRVASALGSAIEPCVGGVATGSVAFEAPDGCDVLSVFVHAPATTGTIVVE